MNAANRHINSIFHQLSLLLSSLSHLPSPTPKSTLRTTQDSLVTSVSIGNLLESLQSLLSYASSLSTLQLLNNLDLQDLHHRQQTLSSALDNGRAQLQTLDAEIQTLLNQVDAVL